MYAIKGQLDIFGNEVTKDIEVTTKKPSKPPKEKRDYFVIAYSKYHFGKMKVVIKNAVSIEQAKYFFHKLYDERYQYDVRVGDCWPLAKGTD